MLYSPWKPIYTCLLMILRQSAVDGNILNILNSAGTRQQRLSANNFLSNRQKGRRDWLFCCRGVGRSASITQLKSGPSALFNCFRASVWRDRFVDEENGQTKGGSQILGSHGGDYEDRRLLGYKTTVCTSQETHYISTTEPSRLMLCEV
jgi:hypothetical protein